MAATQRCRRRRFHSGEPGPGGSFPRLPALLLVLYFVDPFIGDWDGMDYTMLSLAGYPSSMALGRNLFIFGNHFLYRVGPRAFQRSAGTTLIWFSSTRWWRRRRWR